MSDPIRTEIVYGMPFETYAAHPGIHKSMLDEFARCPLAGYEYMTARVDAPTDAMRFGSAVDCLLCEPDQFASRFWIRPDTYETDGIEKPWSGNSKVCKEWLASHRSKPVLTADKATEAKRTVDAILADPKAAKLLHNCKTQISMFWSDPVTGLQMKGRPDFIGPNYAIDLKTARDASEQAISRAIAQYRYHVQAAIYTDGLRANGVDCDAFYFLFVEPGDRPKPNVRKLKAEAIELGRFTYSAQLQQVRNCMRDNSWPGFSGAGPDVLEIDVPAWLHANGGGALSLTIGGEEMPL